MNSIYQDIVELFEAAGVENFEKLPDTDAEKAQFAKLFKQFNDFLEAQKYKASIGIRKFTLLNMRMAQKERCVLHWIKIHI